MLTCPVCRSQNMDSAKFCGNCGTPFPRSPVPSSSLVNCPQGHIYSAVYEHCPYCPLPETAVVSEPVAANADFATKVEAQEPAETIGADRARRSRMVVVPTCELKEASFARGVLPHGFCRRTNKISSRRTRPDYGGGVISANPCRPFPPLQSVCRARRP